MITIILTGQHVKPRIIQILLIAAHRAYFCFGGIWNKRYAALMALVLLQMQNHRPA
jgi:hypothetical protein